MTTWVYIAPMTALQTFALIWFCSAQFPARFRLPANPLLKSGAFLIADAVACLLVYLASRVFSRVGMAFDFFCILLVQFGICTLLFCGDPYYKFFNLLFANVYFTGVLMTARFAKDALLLPGALPTPVLYNLFVNILPQCAAIVALIPVHRKAVRLNFYLSPPRFYWFSAYLIYVALYFGMMYTTDALLRWNLVSGLSVLLEVALLAMSVAFYLMFLSICNSYHEKIQHSLIEQQYALQTAHFAEVQTANQALRELRHELKNYMFYMNYLIDQGDFDRLRRFFSEFYQKEHRNLYEISGSDSFLDAVLQQKITAARALGAEVTEHVLLPDDDTLNNLDLCIVLSNLIDNAVEACHSLAHPAIDIRLKRVKDYVSVVVENTASMDVLKQNPLMRTSKGDKETHGIGLRVIRQIVERYDGSIEFDSDEGHFKTMLMMKIPAGTDEEVSQ